MTTLVLVLKEILSDDKTMYHTFYSNSKVKTVINENEIDDVFKPIYTTVISYTQNYFRKVSDWIIDSAIDQTISFLKYNPSTGNCYIDLPK